MTAAADEQAKPVVAAAAATAPSSDDADVTAWNEKTYINEMIFFLTI